MLTELAVSDLGVIGELSLVLGPGMTAVTGETGAGKTLIVEAIELLMGGRADPSMVRHGATEAVVEGRFVVDGAETVLRRVVPAEGRSRAYVDDRLATAGSLAELGRSLVDLHGQHDHQSLLGAAVQRDALDRFGGIDLGPLLSARKELQAVERELGELGGDERARAREIDLLRFQVGEIDAAGLSDPDEDEQLDGARVGAGRRAGPPGGGTHRATSTSAATRARPPGWPVPWPHSTGEVRSPSWCRGCAGIEAELADVASEVRAVGESIEDDPVRLTEVQERRRLLHELRAEVRRAPRRRDGFPRRGVDPPDAAGGSRPTRGRARRAPRTGARRAASGRARRGPARRARGAGTGRRDAGPPPRAGDGERRDRGRGRATTPATR